MHISAVMASGWLLLRRLAALPIRLREVQPKRAAARSSAERVLLLQPASTRDASSLQALVKRGTKPA
jgi:hypothetical protein